MVVKPSAPEPHPSATLVLLRDRPRGGVEVLLIQRHHGSRFAGGDHVFPGGKVEADDDPLDAAAWCVELDEAEAARRLGLPSSRRAMAYWIGAIREAFEEVGVLVAVDRVGGPIRLDAEALAGYRRACQKDSRVFWEMVRREQLRIATDRLRYFAHWMTPEERPLRFDTRFFAAEMPPGQEAVADEEEIVGVRWLSPGEALEARRRGEISLRLPTARNLTLFADAPSVAEALRRLADRPVTMVRPRILTEGGVARTVLPGDPGWF